jgi:hypothetical protein
MFVQTTVSLAREAAAREAGEGGTVDGLNLSQGHSSGSNEPARSIDYHKMVTDEPPAGSVTFPTAENGTLNTKATGKWSMRSAIARRVRGAKVSEPRKILNNQF